MTISKIQSSHEDLTEPHTFLVGSIDSEHIWVFYLLRDLPSLTDASTNHRFSFETHYTSTGDSEGLKTSSNIKECGARLVYERDLEEFSRFVYGDEAGPIGSSGSGSFDDENESGSDSADDDDEPGIGSSDDDDDPGIGSFDDNNEPESDSSNDDDDEPNIKRFKKV
ncbi:TMV resistance protein N-like [Prunus yedoensis var. nudiflora]|uniref:TMV resistance protein N-like n=1 Tax=Prunus yedoensis var. nudiflora TaxID=2094558 RepID=A0A314YRM6_PRUYE|nr:TMV resistance protein N-like [Prunus yedoensis var. nudiflora]